MDAFFASVEQRDHPELRGKPLLIGSDSPRGVVATASYEARRFGCGSALPMSIAKRRCPQAIIVPPRGKRYREVSDQMFEILHDMVPVVEPLSIDEAFLDLTGSRRALGEPLDIARALRKRIESDLGLTASVGMAGNKYLAKLASDMDKPDGLTVIPADRVTEILDPLPIERMWGVGPATAEKLRSRGLRSMRAVRTLPIERLRSLLGPSADHFQQLARGEDNRPVTPDSAARSVSQECTFDEDLAVPDEVRQVLRGQTDQVAHRLRLHGLSAGNVTVKIRFGNFQTITRSATLPQPSSTTAELWTTVDALFGKWVERSFQPVRLIGMGAAKFGQSERQLGLFGEATRGKNDRLDAALDRIQERFGSGSIRRGSS